MIYQPKLFAFDLDGVITDTADYHFNAWKKLANELNYKFTIEDNERLKGVSRIRSFEIILEINNALDKFSDSEKEKYANIKNDYYTQLIQKITHEDILPGMYNFIEDCKKNNIILTVASASKNAFSVIDSLKLTNSFDYIADAGKIKNSKPDPEVFINCASKFNIDPKDCIGFEDAQAGINAIKSAGMFAVGINVLKSDIECETPHYSLSSTSLLDFNSVIQKYNEYRQNL